MSVLDQASANTIATFTRYTQQFPHLSALFVKALELLSVLQQNFDWLDGVLSRLIQEETKTKSIVEELSALTLWYELCLEGYDHIEAEILRRKEQLAIQQKLIDDFTERLDATWREEEKSRLQFFDRYGRYLPDTLCPELNYKTVRHQITPRYAVGGLAHLSGDRASSMASQSQSQS
jgi:hypothetical protein